MIAAIRKLQPGEVASYGEIAEEAGFPGRARAVGRILSEGPDVPWWRVVRADGSLASPNADEQAHLLREEGVAVAGARVARRAKTRPSPLR